MSLSNKEETSVNTESGMRLSWNQIFKVPWTMIRDLQFV